MDALTQIMAFCGIISTIGGAGAVVYKVVRPAFKLQKRVEQLEKYAENDNRKINDIAEMQKVQSKCLASITNNIITGNGIEGMKTIRDELLESIIDK